MGDEIKLSELNHTELLTLAKGLNPDVCRTTPKEVLIELIECDPGEEPVIPALPINKHRRHIMKFVIANWSRLGALVDCPARSLDPFACYQCLDMQVAECWVTNEHIIPTEDEEPENDSHD